MRMDVKVGIAVVVVVIVLVGLYFAFRDDATNQPQASQPTNPPAGQPRTISAPTADPTRTTTAAPVAPSSPAAPAMPIAGAGTGATTRPAGRIGDPPTGTLAGGATVPNRGGSLSGTGTGGTAVTLSPIRPEGAAPVGVNIATTQPVTTSRSYIVKAGDMGFADIARKEYGNSKYWSLIAEANKGVNTSSLKPGQKLILPPLPSQTPQRAGATPAAPAVLASGAQEYVIQATDTDGFWGIASRKLGNGKYADAIVKANPGVNPSSLRPGQKIILPKIDQAVVGGSIPVRTSPIGAGPGPVAPAGGEVYTVLNGDTAWKIAAKKYGNGSYLGMIAKANPGVDLSRIAPGQKLILPSKAQADNIIATARGGSPSTVTMAPPAAPLAPAAPISPASDNRPRFRTN